MSNKVLLLENGVPVTAEGTANGQVLTWDEDTNTASFQAGGGGSGTVTSVGLTGGTSGIVIGGSTSPITSSGTYNLDAPRRFAFDTTNPIAPTAAGQMSWNATEGSLNTMMVGGNVDAIVGQQLYQRAVNNDTVTLTKGMVVYVDGSSGTRVTVKRAIASGDLTSATIIGVVAETIAVNAAGFVITEGTLKDLNVLPSTSFTDGAVVYLSPTTAGGLTTEKPIAPNHLVMVGYCVKASNGDAGILLVKTQNGYELGELHDVYINSPTSGQILIYDATTGQTRWENASLTGGTGVTVTPGPGSLSVAIGQSVATGASPTFAGLTLTGFSGLIRATAGSLAGSATVVGSDFGSQTANTVFAAPNGASGDPSFRALVAADIPSLSATYLPLSGGTLTGKLITATPAFPGNAGLNLPHGVTPLTLVNGDIWTTAFGLFARINGGTQQFAALNQNNIFTHQSGSYSTGTTSGTVNLASGATTSGQTKTVNIGTGGLSGSTTTITIGAISGTNTTTLNGALTLAALTGYVKANGASTATASTTVPTSDLNGQVALTNGGTNASLTAAAGAVAYSTASALDLSNVGISGQVLKSNGTSAPSWTDMPYDLSGEFVGTPASGATIMNFVAVRPFILSTAVAAQFACTSNTGATAAVFTVNVAGVSKGTVSIAGNATSGTGTLFSTGVTTGQVVTVVATTPANVINVWWTLPGLVV